MKTNLTVQTKIYYAESHLYELFSQAEDYPELVLEILKKYTKDKIILDAGCGDGKYIALLESQVKRYYALDLSFKQLEMATKKIKDHVKVELINADLVNIPLEDNSIEVIICNWVLETIDLESKREKILQEFKRVLKPDGFILLTESTTGGEFEVLRGRGIDKSRTINYNQWVLKNGFRALEEINTYFLYKSLEEAKETITSFHGKELANKITSNKITHNVIVYILEND